MDVYVDGRRLRIDPARAIGKGGEADVFDIGGGQALKLYKQPGHADFAGQPAEQRAASERLAELQVKLRVYPSNLPDRVVRPLALATDREGSTILGYTMRLLKNTQPLMHLSDRRVRASEVSTASVLATFRELHATLSGIHQAGVVVGDFNDLNVLVNGTDAWMIDADSFQFGRFYSRVFTARFVDPALCDPGENAPVLTGVLSRDSDWYAFAVMLFQSLLCVDPYAGVYRPADTRKLVPHAARTLHRITVFDPDVRYPKPAIPYRILREDLQRHFRDVFEHDRRGDFPLELLSPAGWIRCPSCGIEHARPSCPVCRIAIAVAVPSTVRGRVMAIVVFRTTGRILRAEVQDGRLLVLHHEGEFLRREDSSPFAEGDMAPGSTFAVSGDTTAIVDHGKATLHIRGRAPEQLSVESAGGVPCLAANARHRFWIDAGVLWRDGTLGPERIGDVLAGQTRYWVGPRFGVGFYRAGGLTIGFTFDAERGGINDTVTMPRLIGHLVDADCAFADDRCWLFLSVNEGGRSMNRCVVVRWDGAVLASAEDENGAPTWLGGIHGRCAIGESLLAATDDGIVRVEARDGHAEVAKTFPDTEPSVDAASVLLAGDSGLYVVGRQEITLLRLG